MNNYKSIVISRLKYYRELRNISQDQLSLMIGRNKDFIKKLEGGFYKKEPTLDTVQKIAAIFNISTNELLKEELKK